jgi:modification methylase|tara:strand:- start:55 stop:891 length:837 start_codon:yes stop_codon:yes gene_type:complete
MKNKIFKGDVLEVLKTFDNDIIDLIVTSPPYNKRGHGGPIVKTVKYDVFDDTLPEEVYQEQQVSILNEIYRVTKPGGSIFYNHRCRWDNGELIHPMEWLIKTDWQPKQEIIWDRYISAQLRGWRFWQVDERIYWLYKPLDENQKVGKELKSKHARMSSIWSFPPERDNPHPAPYPLVLPLRIILSVLDEERGLVLDPYMGSGTTAVAAKLLGSDYVGIDISEKYIKEAEDRIDKFESERSILHTEKELHTITTTYRDRKRTKEIKQQAKKLQFDFWDN